MKKVTVFYLESCPYCKNARRAVEELKAENPRYAEPELEWINEEKQPELAEQYEYFSVPSMFIGKEKLYEAHLGERYEECREHVRQTLEAALK
ncbi:glutaredoxin [Fusobacterium naviforme]|uniref:Glutaredoxin n=1 Tax=Moryella indoligenes TaxID=371674 RepID=A0AAE3V8M2_9FIRM|nr:thioredoxin family protein [Moryella indoligenes]KAB0576214.1 thioredoxin family protein [Fusobacterium naviforme]MDQ0151612.1 glutaredoxin [Moryella indoligenes]PSL09019.1 glutaredoxin [Fusobacterium naviforme]STO28226.1 redox-active disulfide protein 1 [Fusobacterium naviforme]